MTEMYAAIRKDLQSLQESRRPLDKVHGSWSHQFRTRPPLTEDEVRQFESANRVVLPAEYRSFLIHVANGGAGPYYGLFRLGGDDDFTGEEHWLDFVVGDVSAPFPHTTRWNDMSGYPGDDADDADRERWEETYFHAVCGAVPICHLGCALRQWLVVTGPEAGNVWCDSRADYGGFTPLDRDGSPRVTFLEWYRAWLDEAVRQLRETDAEPGDARDGGVT
jgi:hypothetical protein